MSAKLFQCALVDPLIFPMRVSTMTELIGTVQLSLLIYTITEGLEKVVSLLSRRPRRRTVSSRITQFSARIRRVTVISLKTRYFRDTYRLNVAPLWSRNRTMKVLNYIFNYCFRRDYPSRFITPKIMHSKVKDTWGIKGYVKSNMRSIRGFIYFAFYTLLGLWKINFTFLRGMI